LTVPHFASRRFPCAQDSRSISCSRRATGIAVVTGDIKDGAAAPEADRIAASGAAAAGNLPDKAVSAVGAGEAAAGAAAGGGAPGGSSTSLPPSILTNNLYK
jgi:hypothetical protein